MPQEPWSPTRPSPLAQRERDPLSPPMGRASPLTYERVSPCSVTSEILSHFPFGRQASYRRVLCHAASKNNFNARGSSTKKYESFSGGSLSFTCADALATGKLVGNK
ncbi:hypothetical protein E2C01_062715 [Portunus trituberculatus]|uniref:Uncharacterized protein n=1 Tax=Portunus trituberculatus TaxID=210409 RepID=A0A5B7HEG2_PORTR|nr:hypothetical protein [Portunus trituberculatus]